jgi:integrase
VAVVDRAQEEGGEPRLLKPIRLHECRHTFASLLIEAGVSAKKVSKYIGHAGVAITLDR